jgi:transposase
MKFIQGKNRLQTTLFQQSLEEMIEPDNEVRIIDLFVESINLSDFKFIVKESLEGRPAYDPKDLLRLYVYGYLNSIRSSRSLEKECKRNIELRWLMHDLVPDHNTISNFRRDNEKAIRKVFRYTVSIAKQFDLIGGKLVAGDSTKLRAQNSKKNNFNEKKIEQHLSYIDDKLKQYNKALDEADQENKQIIDEQIKKQIRQQRKYNSLRKQLQETGEVQVSTSDPDSRQLLVRNNITEVAYSVQTVVDAKNNIPIDYKVTNENDSKAMGPMLRRSTIILGTSDFTGLFDKGYHTGTEIKTAVNLGINIMVAIPEVASNAPDPAYNVANFKYDQEKNVYTCPQGQTLTTNGRWYNKHREKSCVKIKHYKTKACATCPVKDLCTRNKDGRLIERNEYAPFIEQNRLNIEANYETYKRRQAIVEHPYGVIKRQWGFYFISTKKGIKRASADVGLMFVAYNLRRLINIIGQNVFKKFLEELCLFVFQFLGLHKLQKCILKNLYFLNLPNQYFFSLP